MGYYNFFGVLEIIKGPIKILPKNGKIIASIATLGLLLHSLSFLLNTFFMKPFLSGMNAKSTNLASKNLSESESANLLHGVIKDASILIGVSLAHLLIYILIALFINASTVYASAMAYYRRDLSLEDVILRVIRSFKRIFITTAHVTGRIVCWLIVYFMVSIGATLLIFPDYPIFVKSLVPALGVLICIYIIYLSVVWVLAFVISVIEENCYGSEALRKAEGLVKGRRVDGFVLNLVFNLFIVIILKVNEIIVKKWPSKEIVMGLFITCTNYLVTMFLFIAYTLLYFKCKESHGEEIELGGKLKYSKVPTAPLLNEDVP